MPIIILLIRHNYITLFMEYLYNPVLPVEGSSVSGGGGGGGPVCQVGGGGGRGSSMSGGRGGGGQYVR